MPSQESRLEIFARACGARRGIVLCKAARVRAALHNKATLEKP